MSSQEEEMYEALQTIVPDSDKLGELLQAGDMAQICSIAMESIDKGILDQEVLDTLMRSFGESGEVADQPSLDSVVSRAQVEAAYTRFAEFHQEALWRWLKSGNVFGVQVRGNTSFCYVQLLGGGSKRGVIAGGCNPGVKCYKSIKDIFAAPGQYTADVLCLDYEPKASSVQQDMQQRLGLQVVPGAYPDLTLWCGSPLRAGLPSSAQLEWLSAALQMLIFVTPTITWDENKPSYTLSESNGGGEYLPCQLKRELTNLRDETIEGNVWYPHSLDGAEVRQMYRHCAMCDAPGADKRCGRCKAYFYCGANCQKRHWKQHKHNCHLFQEWMSEAAALDQPFFTFPRIAHTGWHRWLVDAGVHGCGMWRRECSCYSHLPIGSLTAGSGDDSWGLKEYPPSSPVSSERLQSPLKCWEEYYAARELPADSPVAHLLSFPLTVYHCLNLDAQNTPLVGSRCIHYLAAAKELDMMVAMTELGHLLPELKIEMHMVGPEVHVDSDGCHQQLTPNFSVQFHRGKYHDIVDMLPKPDIAVALNAGLEATEHYEWSDTIRCLRGLCPVYVSDYSRSCCVNAISMLAQECQVEVDKESVVANPFRSPIHLVTPTMNMPWFSNGFLITLK